MLLLQIARATGRYPFASDIGWRLGAIQLLTFFLFGRSSLPWGRTLSAELLSGVANFPKDACKATARAASPLIRLSQDNSKPLRLPFAVSLSPAGDIARTWSRPLMVNARLSVFSRGVVMTYGGREQGVGG